MFAHDTDRHVWADVSRMTDVAGDGVTDDGAQFLFVHFRISG